MSDIFEAEKRFIKYAETYKIKKGTPTYHKCCNAFCVGFKLAKTTQPKTTGLRDQHGREGFEGDIFRVVVGRHYWLYEVKSFGDFGNNLYAVCYEHNEQYDVGDEFDPVFTYKKVTVTQAIRDCITKLKTGTILGNINDFDQKPTGW